MSITINNPRRDAVSIQSVFTRFVPGVLDATGWTTIPGWNTTAMPNATAQFATDLTQTDPAMTGMTIAANGGTRTFGNVWQKTPFAEDILIRLTRNDNEIAVYRPAIHWHSGDLHGGDFDTNGAINLADFQIFLNNLHTNPAQLRACENYQPWRDDRRPDHQFCRLRRLSWRVRCSERRGCVR